MSKTFIKLHDAYYDDPSVMRAGPMGEVLYVRGLAWCGRNRSDGFIPRQAVARLEVGLDEDARACLVDAGLWQVQPDGGVVVRNYLAWQTPASAIASAKVLSEKRREAGRKGAASRWQNGKTNGTAMANTVATDGIEVRSKKLEEPNPPSVPPFGADFEEWWEAYPKKRERQRALKAYQARRRQGADPSALLAAAKHYAQSRAGQDPQYTKLAATFIGPSGPWEEFVAPEAAVAPPAPVRPMPFGESQLERQQAAFRARLVSS